MKITNTQSHNGVTVTHGILKLIEAVNSEKALLSINRTRINPIIISETESIEKRDKYYYNFSIHESAGGEIEKGNYKECRKILVLPENFSIEAIQMITDGKLKDGDKVMVECEESFSAKCLEPDGKCNCGGDNDLCDRTYYYEITINSNNHINLIVPDRQENWYSLFKLPPHYSKVEQIGYSGAGNHSVAQLEKIVENYKEVIHQLRLEKQHVIDNYNLPTKIK